MKQVDLSDAWEGMADCQACTLRQSALFQGLKEPDFALVHNAIDQFRVSTGEQIHSEGETGQYMFTIRSGLVKLVQYLPDGAQRIVRLLKATDVLGMEILLDNTYQYHAVALQETEICRYPASAVKELAASNPALHKSLMEQWQRALNEAELWLTQLSTGTSKQRISRLLVHLVDENADNQCTLFNREDLGSMMAITTETASRIIAKFVRQGILVKKGQNQFICDTEKLKQITEE